MLFPFLPPFGDNINVVGQNPLLRQHSSRVHDIVDNVKGMTSVGGIVKNFAVRAMENQSKRYAAEDAAEAAEMDAAAEQASPDIVP